MHPVRAKEQRLAEKAQSNKTRPKAKLPAEAAYSTHGISSQESSQGKAKLLSPCVRLLL